MIYLNDKLVLSGSDFKRIKSMYDRSPYISNTDNDISRLHCCKGCCVQALGQEFDTHHDTCPVTPSLAPLHPARCSSQTLEATFISCPPWPHNIQSISRSHRFYSQNSSLIHSLLPVSIATSLVQALPAPPGPLQWSPNW